MRETIRELACGFVLCAAERASDVTADAFDPSGRRWRAARVHTSTGRAHVLIATCGDETWVLRHYHRGGMVARFVDDHYAWLGLQRTRAFVEWRLLRTMRSWHLPCPEPVAANVRRRGLLYKCQIITRFLPATRTLSAHIRAGPVAIDTWQAIGNMLGAFHSHGVVHPDLTAHNILIDADGNTFLVDFDSARLRRPGSWQAKGISRLQRSLCKVALETGTEFDPGGWRALMSAYAVVVPGRLHRSP